MSDTADGGNGWAADGRDSPAPASAADEDHRGASGERHEAVAATTSAKPSRPLAIAPTMKRSVSVLMEWARRAAYRRSPPATTV